MRPYDLLAGRPLFCFPSMVIRFNQNANNVERTNITIKSAITSRQTGSRYCYCQPNTIWSPHPTIALFLVFKIRAVKFVWVWFVFWKFNISPAFYIDGSVQHCSICIANALDLLQSSAKPSICMFAVPVLGAIKVIFDNLVLSVYNVT